MEELFSKSMRKLSKSKAVEFLLFSFALFSFAFSSDMGGKLARSENCWKREGVRGANGEDLKWVDCFPNCTCGSQLICQVANQFRPGQ